MSDLNRCEFIGRLGKDPETRYTKDGSAVTSISIACGWKSKNGEGTEWVPIVFFGRQAEIAGEYLRKGSQCYVGGRFHTEKWQDKEGATRYTTKIVGNFLQLLGGKPDGAKAEHAGESMKAADTAEHEFDDDIPF
jgi:single-strand DNA-binding protein